MNKRLLPLLLLVGVLLGACSTGFDDPSNPQLGEIESGGQALPALLTGLTEPQLASYLEWFRGTDPTSPAIIEPQLADGNNSGDTRTVHFVDPACALEYDYARMADGWGDNRKAEIRLADANTGGSGFYNPARQEALLLLQGYAFSGSGRNAICRTPLWVPIRVNLSSGVWTVEGYTTPATNVQISVTGSHALVPVISDVEFAGDVNDFVSPPRLNRFKVTDENFSRVMRYATVSNRGGASRHIAWFRQSDISPNYAHLSSGTDCTPAYFAFWGWAGSHSGRNLAPCQAAWGNHSEGDPSSAGDDFDSDSEMWLDELARMNSGGDNVWETNADDRCDITRDGACRLQENEGWKKVGELLTCLTVRNYGAADGGICGANRAETLSKLKALLTQHGALAENDIPDIFGGWDHTDPDVFGVIVANGNEAWTQTRNNMKDKPALNGFTGFVGKSECNFSPCGRENSITVTASFQYDQVNTDEGAAAFYNAHSLLSGDKMMNVMSFSTADATAVDGAGDSGLIYEQAPLGKVEIVVSDPLNQGNQSRYTSHWLPLYSIGRNGSELTYSKAFDLLGDPGGSLQRAFSDLLYNIYRSTLGSWVAGVSQAATSTMLAVPNLEPYQVAYYNQFNEPIYTLNRELIRPDLVRYNVNSREVQLIDEQIDYSRLSGDALTCTQAALSGNLSEPTAATDVCFAKNGLFSVWFWIRGLVMVILLWHVFAYGYGLITRKHEGDHENFISPVNFMARMGIVLFLIFGMETILFVLQTIVGETIVITNLIGTQVAGGTPYNHLWLFGSFLNTPTREVSIFGLIILAPFTLIGLIALLMAAWLRIGITFALIILSPWWAMSLLSSREPVRFYASLKLLLRLYLIPLLVLVMLLIMFVAMRWLGADLSQDGGLLAAVISMGLLVTLAVAPFFLSKWAFGSMLGKVEATMKAVTNKQKEAAKTSTALEGATGAPQQLPGGVGRPQGAPQGAGPRALGTMMPPPPGPGGMGAGPRRLEGGPTMAGPQGAPAPDAVAQLTGGAPGGGEVSRVPAADGGSRGDAAASTATPRWARKGRMARIGDALGAAGKKAAGAGAAGLGAGVKGTVVSGALGSEFTTMSGATGSKAVLESAWMLTTGREALPEWVNKKVDFKKVDDKVKSGFGDAKKKIAGHSQAYQKARAERAALEHTAREADADVVSAQRRLSSAQAAGDQQAIAAAETDLRLTEQRAVNAYTAMASVSRATSLIDAASDPLGALRRPLARRGESAEAERRHFEAWRRMADLAADKAKIERQLADAEAANPEFAEQGRKVAELEAELAELAFDDPRRPALETQLSAARDFGLSPMWQDTNQQLYELRQRKDELERELARAGDEVARSQDSIDAIANRRAWRERAAQRATADNASRYEEYHDEIAARTAYWNQQAAALSEQLNNPTLDASTRRALESERAAALREAQQLSQHQTEVGRNAAAGRWFKTVYGD